MTAVRPGWATASGHVHVRPHDPSGSGLPAGEEALARLLVAERIARYGWAYDERNREALGDCFTADGVWEGSLMGEETVGPHTGRTAIADFLASFWPQQDDQRRHVFTDVVVDGLDAGAATAHAYLVLTSVARGRASTVSTGPYRFQLVREDVGGWRIARLSAGFDCPF
jgi:SnoaL-like domain